MLQNNLSTESKSGFWCIGLRLLEGHSSAQFNPNQTHLIQIIKVFRVTRNFQAGVIWSWLELNCAALWPSRKCLHPCSNVNQGSNSTLMWFNKTFGKMKKSSYPWLLKQPAPCCIFPAIEYFVPHHSQDPNKENTFIHCRPKITFLCILFNGLQYFCFQISTFKADPV